jgi:glycosyltransferase involved in cell wall biosynthesis
LLNEIPNFENHLQIKLIGAVSESVLKTITDFGLKNYILNLGYLSHKEAVIHQRKSQVLLLIEINSPETKSIIPGKLFEYMVSNRPIIAIGPKNSDFSEIITTTNTGIFFEYSEKDKLKALILEHYNKYLKSQLKVNGVGIEQYSRRKLTEKLAFLIKD